MFVVLTLALAIIVAVVVVAFASADAALFALSAVFLLVVVIGVLRLGLRSDASDES